MSKRPANLELPRVPKPGSSLRIEFDLSEFHCWTMALRAADVGELSRLLMIEAVGGEVPPASNEIIQRAYDRRNLYSRIRGGFGRTSISLAKRKAVYERDGRRCGYCEIDIAWSEYHCDHVEPASKGGSDDMSNLRASCWRCNLAKKDKTLEVWRP